MCYCQPNVRTPFCNNCAPKMFQDIQQLKQQRDELLEALRIAVEEYRKLPHSLGYEFTHIPFMEAAISKATSK